MRPKSLILDGILCAVERLLDRVCDEALDDPEKCSKNESNGADNEQEVEDRLINLLH